MVYQIGLPLRRIDVLTSISGVDFQEAAAEALSGRIGSCEVPFIGEAALSKNESATGRAKDIAGVERLLQLKCR